MTPLEARLISRGYNQGKIMSRHVKPETKTEARGATTHRLFNILNMKRPGGSEAQVAQRWLIQYDAECFYDEMGQPMAWAITVGQSDTLFSAHLDTVHNAAGERKVKYDPKKGVVSSPDGTPLGADDGAGIWLLLEMIDAGVPGEYLFTVGEELGGIGAKFMAKNHDAYLSNFKRAVAFDRKATHSVITHQAWGRCCSDAFAEDLAGQLNNLLSDDYAFMVPDDTGIYTDTAEYTHLIPECTNISAGYNQEHSAKETLDLGYLLALRDACLLMDWDSLTTARDVNEVEPAFDIPSFGYSKYTKSWIDADDLADMRFKDIIEYVQDTSPEEVADLLDQMAMEISDLKQKMGLN